MLELESERDWENEHQPTVLIVQAETSVLVLLSGMFRANGVRPLLARTTEEAMEIAARQYIPIDAVMCDVRFVPESGPDVVDDIRALRPGIRPVYLSAVVDDGAIRMKIMRQVAPKYFIHAPHVGPVEAVRGALSAQLLRAGA